MQWQADTIQAIVYYLPNDPTYGAAEIWGQLFPGDSPDAFQRNPTSPVLESSASGERRGHNVAINSRQGQLIININPVFQSIPGLTPPLSEPPRIQNIEDATFLVIEFAKIVSVARSVARIALVLDLARTVPNGFPSVDLLKSSLPHVFFPENAIEPSYGFNAQRRFEVADHITMNRICAWTTGQVTFFAGNTPGTVSNASVSTTNYLGFKIDVNSMPTVPLIGAPIREMWDELSREAVAVWKYELAYFL
ncbi:MULTISPECIES: hypothetical protein [unclassified Sphingomonas]|uniref:hypothetical protein n=1 Tax=unclassified Sphingomonas TaxID=196159 RepID=UPI000AE3D5C2|nr:MULTISPECIES: hypothetical protein [unclassified Sphingomonas]